MSTEYENLTKEYDKSKNVVEREGIPNFYVKCLADLEDYLQQVCLFFIKIIKKESNCSM